MTMTTANLPTGLTHPVTNKTFSGTRIPVDHPRPENPSYFRGSPYERLHHSRQDNKEWTFPLFSIWLYHSRIVTMIFVDHEQNKNDPPMEVIFLSGTVPQKI